MQNMLASMTITFQNLKTNKEDRVENVIAIYHKSNDYGDAVGMEICTNEWDEPIWIDIANFRSIRIRQAN